MKNSTLLAAGLTALSACNGMQNDPTTGDAHPDFIAATEHYCPKDKDKKPVPGTRMEGVIIMECIDTNHDGVIDIQKAVGLLSKSIACIDRTGKTFEGQGCDNI